MDSNEISDNKGKLYIVSTPIGNKDDISVRAINTIKRCDIIVCEEMKMGALTLKNLNLAKELIPLNENNESDMTMEVLNLLRSGKKIALISDAGTPIFADPGLYLLRSAVSNNIEVEVVPGASSIMTAIVRSGFDIYEFLYAGFLPRKNEDRDRKIAKLARERRTVVIFETPYRLHTILAAFAEIIPQRKIYLGMNLTMPFETHHYGTFEEIVKKFENSKIKSEFVIVMEGNKDWIGKKIVEDVDNYDDDDDDDDEEVEYEYPVKAHVQQIQDRDNKRGFADRKPGSKFNNSRFGSKPGGFAKREGGSSYGDRSGFPKREGGSSYSDRGGFPKREGGSSYSDRGGFAKREGGSSYSDRGGFPKREGGSSYGDRGGFTKREGGSSYSDRGGFAKKREGGGSSDRGGFPKREGGGSYSDRGGFAKREGGGSSDRGGFPKREGGGSYSDRGGFAKREGGSSYSDRGGFAKREGGSSDRRKSSYSDRKSSGSGYSADKKFKGRRDSNDGGFSFLKKDSKGTPKGRFGNKDRDDK